MRGHLELFIPTINHVFVNFRRKVEKIEKSLSIHHKNFRSLAIEIYKFLHNLCPSILSNIFKVNQGMFYDFRKQKVLQTRNLSSVKYGIKTISYQVPKIWSFVPKTIKNYKVKIVKVWTFSNKQKRKWKPDCPRRLCKFYLQHVGFFFYYLHYYCFSE